MWKDWVLCAGRMPRSAGAKIILWSQILIYQGQFKWTKDFQGPFSTRSIDSYVYISQSV